MRSASSWPFDTGTTRSSSPWTTSAGTSIRSTSTPTVLVAVGSPPLRQPALQRCRRIEPRREPLVVLVGMVVDPARRERRRERAVRIASSMGNPSPDSPDLERLRWRRLVVRARRGRCRRGRATERARAAAARERERDVAAHGVAVDVGAARGPARRARRPRRRPAPRSSTGPGGFAERPVPRLSNASTRRRWRSPALRPRRLLRPAETRDQEQRKALAVLLDVEVDQTRSTIIAMPCPPPTHIVSRPIVPSSASRSLSSVHMIRAPVMP